MWVCGLKADAQVFPQRKKNDDIIDTSFEIETSNEEDSEDNGEKQNVEETKVIT